MKKACILTIFGNVNYGNKLQNYATQSILESWNIECETLINTTQYNKNSVLKKIRKYNYNFKVIIIKIKARIDYIFKKKHIDMRQKRFEVFNDKYLKMTKFKVDKDCIPENLGDTYDYFIIGSDQVWNPNAYRVSEIDFALFAPKKKNISFAASFGVNGVPEEYIELYRLGLNNINHISVREEQGKKIVKDIFGLNSEVLMDPTMMLSAEEWDKVSKRPEQLQTDKYILNYFLGEIPKEWSEEINRVAKENNCEVINILDKNSPFYQTGPSEFLYLEKNAFMICTDSFHSCIFAIIYNVPFINFERQGDVWGTNMNSRLETLLSKFNLQNRRFEGKITEELLSCGYSEAKKILEVEKEKSINFLRKALEL